MTGFRGFREFRFLGRPKRVGKRFHVCDCVDVALCVGMRCNASFSRTLLNTEMSNNEVSCKKPPNTYSPAMLCYVYNNKIHSLRFVYKQRK